uniref:EF-hand domain-containing protein n=2 Tax=Hemiselmis andersenii TaxID=464988 RepID=A0A6U4NCR9_HEMAN
MAVENVLRLVHEAYEVKILADIKDDAADRPRQSFTDFLKSFLVRKYGLKSIATKQLGEIYNSVIAQEAKLERVRCFGLISGMVDKEGWSQGMCDFTLNMLKKVCDLDGRAPNNISEWLSADKEPGATPEAAALAMHEVSRTKVCPLAASDSVIEEIGRLPKNEAGNVIVHNLLMFAIEYHKKSVVKVKSGFMKLFLQHDTNGDGVLELQEFSAMIKNVSSMNDEREICALYEEAAAFEDDDDDTITKETFAELASKYQFECPTEFLDDDPPPE